MMRFLFIKSISFFFLISSLSRAGEVSFTRYTVGDGLPQNTVYCSFQDSRGFMWFGTQDGLSRFDGYEFKTFRHRPGDSTSLSNNWIWNVYEDSSGFLWVGTFGGGACRYDPATESLVSYLHDPGDPASLSDNTVWSFYEHPQGTLWIAANTGLNRLNMETGMFEYYNPTPNAPNVFSVDAGKQNTLWLLTAAGPGTFDVTSKQFEPFDGRKILNTEQDLFVKGRRSAARMGMNEHGISILDFRTAGVRHYSWSPSLHETVPAIEQISNSWIDATGSIWLGTRREGLFVLHHDQAQITGITRLKHDDFDDESLSHDRVTSIYEDPTGGMWIGAREGLNHYDPKKKKFRLIRSSPNRAEGLTHDNVLPVITSRREPGIAWVGTYDGLNRIDPGGNRIVHYRHDPGNPSGSIAGNHIVSLHEDRVGNLWVGTWGSGITRMRFRGSHIEYTHFRHDPGDRGSIGSNNIYCMYEDNSGRFWVGTGNGGLYRFEQKSTKFIRYGNQPNGISDPYVTSLHEDKAGRFWVGTASGGLYLFNRENETFFQFAHDPSDSLSLSNDRVLCIVETRAGDIWIGTAAGLNRLIPPSGPDERFTFAVYRESHGLPNEVVYGILEDGKGNLWIGTNRGLARLAFGDSLLDVRVYGREDGLQGNEFNTNAFHVGADGTMYFGGTNGLNYFHPDSVRDNSYEPQIVFTDFRIYNETVPIRAMGRTEAAFSLGQSIVLTKEISLLHDLNVFSFEYSALDFSSPGRNQYRYRMEGFDQNWIESGTRRSTTYTNLDPGEYVFRVRGTNGDGVWSRNEAAVSIVIEPPPWKTWWAYLLYVLLLLGGTGLFVRGRVEQRAREVQARADIDRAKAEERERMRRKSSADFHDEAGHLLTKITLFLELAKRKAVEDHKMHDYLSKIEEHSKSLSAGMRDFIWGLDPEKDTLNDTLVRLKDFGNQMFQHSGIRFQGRDVEALPLDLELPMDVRRSIVFIFKEAMNNCLKYSKAGEVSLHSRTQNGSIVLSLRDNGVGFSSPGAGDSYGLRNMKMRAERVGGELEIRSGPGEGTEVVLSLPIPHMGRDRA